MWSLAFKASSFERLIRKQEAELWNFVPLSLFILNLTPPRTLINGRTFIVKSEDFGILFSFFVYSRLDVTNHPGFLRLVNILDFSSTRIIL